MMTYTKLLFPLIKRSTLVITCGLFLFFSSLSGKPPVVVDEIVATIGDQIILQSDIEQQYLQYKAQGVRLSSDRLRCEILNDFVMQKLMVHQAELDSVEISDAQVEMQLDQRMKYFVDRIGSEEKLEDYFGKSIAEIKQDLRRSVYEQLLMQSVQMDIVGDVNVSPFDVRRFYMMTPPDSLPFVETQIQISQIVKYPPYTEEAIMAVNNRLLDIRKRVIEGERFSTMAVLYSECASSSKGGELGFMARGELDPTYADAAFRLQTPGSVSNIVRSDFGYHVIQLIERDGNRVNTRHILLNPRTSPDDAVRLRQELDSIARLIRVDAKLSFPDAAAKFSDDQETRSNGGIVVNPTNNSTYFKMEQLQRADYQAVRNLKEGEISAPFESFDRRGRRLYKIVHVNEIIPPHRANFEQDYHILKELAENIKREKVLTDWLLDKKKTTFMKISDRYMHCENILHMWIIE